jgi:hypothetical protein
MLYLSLQPQTFWCNKNMYRNNKYSDNFPLYSYSLCLFSVPAGNKNVFIRLTDHLGWLHILRHLKTRVSLSFSRSPGSHRNIFHCYTEVCFLVYQHRISHHTGSLKKQGQRWSPRRHVSNHSRVREKPRSFSATAALIGPLVSHLLYLLLPLYHFSSWLLLSYSINSEPSFTCDQTDKDGELATSRAFRFWQTLPLFPVWRPRCRWTDK